ncbi:MAG: polysulfide reductase NrfD [Halobacteria archaeon]|nr:polysulfide reductase NrfD [Halobacteria archaeon]
MIEEVLVTARSNPKIDPSLGIWSWEVPMYLFLGGLTAGIMCFAALIILLRKEDQAPWAAKKMAIWAPVLLTVGMGALFLDLEHKLYVYRFYTTFQISSPMSWGSWILLLVYPVSILLVLCSIRDAYPRIGGVIERFSAGRWITAFACYHRQQVATWSLVLGVFLGFYTGILLSAFSARPFWNTGFLAPLFLISGLSSAAALVVLGTRSQAERMMFTKYDIGLISLELALIALLLVNLATGTGVQLDALKNVMGGEFTTRFWLYFVFIGLLIPVVLNYREISGRRTWAFLSPVLVLYGGYMLRLVTVEAGQVSTWTRYTQSFDPVLLDLLR